MVVLHELAAFVLPVVEVLGFGKAIKNTFLKYFTVHLWCIGGRDRGDLKRRRNDDQAKYFVLICNAYCSHCAHLGKWRVFRHPCYLYMESQEVDNSQPLNLVL